MPDAAGSSWLKGPLDSPTGPLGGHRPVEIERLRRQRWTGKQIASETGVSPATVSRVLRRLGLNKLSALEPAEPIRRYERNYHNKKTARRNALARITG